MYDICRIIKNLNICCEISSVKHDARTAVTNPEKANIFTDKLDYDSDVLYNIAIFLEGIVESVVKQLKSPTNYISLLPSVACN
jgi:hypothetical protein